MFPSNMFMYCLHRTDKTSLPLEKITHFIIKNESLWIQMKSSKTTIFWHFKRNKNKKKIKKRIIAMSTLISMFHLLNNKKILILPWREVERIDLFNRNSFPKLNPDKRFV